MLRATGDDATGRVSSGTDGGRRRRRCRHTQERGDASGEGVVEQSAHPEDPWEGFNRRVFAFNDVLDRYALKPVATGYKTITPQPVQTGVGNFFSNLGEIRTAINSLLQGRPANAGLAASRFLINSTVGVGGLLDYATHMEITAEREVARRVQLELCVHLHRFRRGPRDGERARLGEE